MLLDDADATVFARQVALDWVGEAGIIPNLMQMTGSEDFAFCLDKCKGRYLLLGNHVGQGAGEGGCMVHNPDCDFNDRCLGTGASYWMQPVQAFLVSGGRLPASARRMRGAVRPVTTHQRHSPH